MVLDDYKRVLLPTTRHDTVITAAKGTHIKAKHGNGEEKWVIDGTSQVGTNPLGHRNEELMAAMHRFEEEQSPIMLAGNDFFHPTQRELAERFTDIYPGNLSYGDLKAYYCNSGSEAVERGCLKSAQLYKGGNTYVAFWNAFHGRTSLALSCNFSKAAHTEGYNSLFRALPVPFPDSAHEVDECLDHLRQDVLREGAKNINAVIVEPIQGEGGYNVPGDGFLSGLRRITREHDIPLVLDEVQASLRTGEWFACQNWDIQPDMIAVAKAFSGGVTPFGASLIREEFATDETGKHSGTFGGNPRDCFAALKTIDIIQENDYLEHAKKMGSILETAWDELEDHEAVTESRGIGLMRGIEFATVETRDAVLERLYNEYGILTMACGNDAINPTIRFLLPVNVDKEVVETVADGFLQAVDDVV